MPFIRHARDKRGYETTFVMHAYRGGNGASRTRVLYVFRSPSNLKLGRRALEPEVLEALEHTHPDLTFDWTVLLREPALPRVEPRERSPRHGRAGRGETHGRPPADAPPPVIEDESLLGRTLGARDAARLRTRYQDLLQRIGRRARTPEDRDRLTERLQRLNPEEWADEATIRASAATVDAEWAAIAEELPSRRRGRRAGRFRGEPPPGAPVPAGTSEGEASGIINGEGDSYDEAFDAGVVDADVDNGGHGHGGGVGADAAETAGDSAAPGPAGVPPDDDPAGADGPGLPGGDGNHLD